ncbi:HK97 gp10 family phage protein [Allopontixanthobacter sediminis]|uniref:Uncharacterized protein n=1 Tax=Allopontixanthobacter sediminis TaxID=1689985 RepID=A0A845AVC0_9SPHN|nr:HK97 gp10 family phage protein [Allopontixanthobacter sediminis]MXP42981.1 hypothetical protein [Allopontixanthobacter sediminis]
MGIPSGAGAGRAGVELMSLTVKLDGAAALEKAMAALGDPVYLRRAGLKALREGALPIRDLAQQLVPVDKAMLRESVKVKAGKKGRGLAADRVTYLIGIDVNVQPAREVPRENDLTAVTQPHF